MCYNYDDPCDVCLGDSDTEEQCFFCDKIDCICDDLTDAYRERDLFL